MSKICFTTTELIIFIVINTLTLIYFATKSVEITSTPNLIKTPVKEKIIIKEQQQQQQQQQTPQQPIEIINYPRQLNDPLIGPERNRINHLNYTNIGYVTSPNGDKHIYIW